MAKARRPPKPNRKAQILVSLSLLFMAGVGIAVYFAKQRQVAENAAAPTPLAGFIQDSANLIDRDERMGMEARLRAFDTEGGPQLVVATRYTTDLSIEQEAIRLARAWKIGRAGADNGVLLLLVERDRKARIEVGYGLEGVLTDALTRIIIAEKIAPAIANGDFTSAARNGMDAILAVLHPKPIVVPDDKPGLGSSLGILLMLLVAALVVLGVVQAIVLSVPSWNRRIAQSRHFGWFARVHIIGGSSRGRDRSDSGGSSSPGGGGNFGGGGSSG
jgi:uncharacterized protein